MIPGLIASTDGVGTGGGSGPAGSISLVDWNSNQASTTSLSITKPTGTAQGDLLIAFLSRQSSESWILPSGWSEIDELANPAGTAFRCAVFYKRAGASEPSSYTFEADSSTSRNTAGVVQAWRDVDQANPFAPVYDSSLHRDDIQNTDSPTNQPITTTNDKAVVLLSAHCHSGNFTATVPTGYTTAGEEIYAVTTFVGSVVTAYKEVTPAGTETPGAWSTDADTGTDWVVFTLALKNGT